MGRKSRQELKQELAKEQYIRYLELLADPEYRRRYKAISALDKKMEKIRRDFGKIPSRSADKILIGPDDPDYQHALRRIELDKELQSIRKKKKSLERVLIEDYGLAFPIDPFKQQLTPEDFEQYPSVLFRDAEVIRGLPDQEPSLVPSPRNPRLKKVDFTGYLSPDSKTMQPRYLVVEIDTWNKEERIVAALKGKLEALRGLGIIGFKSRLRRRKVDVEKILQMRAQGMSDYRIMQMIYQTEKHPAHDPETEKYYKRVKRVSQKLKKKK